MNITRRSLIVGVNGYKPTIGSLCFCVSNARRVKNALNKHREGFIATESLLLTEDQASEYHPTKIHIAENVAHLCNAATNEDTLLILFSGHCTIGADGCLYLLPLDASPASIEQTSVSWRWIEEKVEQSHAKNKIIILDVCYPGAGKEIAASVHKSFKIIEELERSGRGFVCITSCSRGQSSYDISELEQGIFSHYLTNGIAGAADPLGHGAINVENLYTFVRDRTLRHAKQIGVEQEPYLISKTSVPLSTFTVSEAHLRKSINRVLVLTEDPILGCLLETGIRLNPLACDAVWNRSIEQAIAEVQTNFGYNAVYIDVRQNFGFETRSTWSQKKYFIMQVRQKYPTVPFVLIGLRELFLKEIEEQDKQKFSHYFFFDLQKPISQVSTLISDTLAQIEWDIRSNYG